jgi:hypothetical protein
MINMNLCFGGHITVPQNGVSRARGRKPSSKSPGPPGWGLMQQASYILIAKKRLAKKPIKKYILFLYINKVLSTDVLCL